MIKRIAINLILLVICIQGYADTYLIAIGVSDYCDDVNYRGVQDLRTAAQDAYSIADFYSNQGGNLHSILLIDTSATRGNILRHMTDFYSQAAEDDHIVLFMACHGARGGFQVHDSALFYNEIVSIMGQSKAHNKIMYIDACLSGGMKKDGVSTTDRETLNQYSIMCFFSSRPNEFSFESPDLKNGIFTTFLIEGLQGKADGNNDAIVTARELFLYVSPMVAKESDKMQHPQMWGHFDKQMPLAIIK